MNENLYTATQRQYIKAKDIDELNSTLADHIMAVTIILMNQLSIYKDLKKPNFFDSTFGNKKLIQEYQACASLMVRLIAVLINSFRHILYSGLTKETTEKVLKEMTKYMGKKLPGLTKFKIQDKQEFTQFLYKQVIKHNVLKSADSFKKDLQFINKSNAGPFTQHEILKIQKFATDGWIRLYPHTYVTHFKRLEIVS